MSIREISLDGNNAFESDHAQTDVALPAFITRPASKQPYYTIRFLVDRDRIADAYRAYAYFRWVDDQLDQNTMAGRSRLAFVARQQALMERCYRGERWSDVTQEEQMLVDL